MGAPSRARHVACGLLLHLRSLSRSFKGLLCQGKIVKKFRGIGISFSIDFLQNQKQAKKTATGTWH